MSRRHRLEAARVEIQSGIACSDVFPTAHTLFFDDDNAVRTSLSRIGTRNDAMFSMAHGPLDMHSCALPGEVADEKEQHLARPSMSSREIRCRLMGIGAGRCILHRGEGSGLRKANLRFWTKITNYDASSSSR